MKTSIKVLVGLSFICVLGFTISNIPQEKELIIGTWVTKGNSVSYRWIFEENGTLIRYSKNTIYKTYNWEITYHKTPSGLTFGHLTLINVDDPKDIYEYRINGLGEKGMHLEYNTGVGLSQLFFERQDKG